MRFTSFECRWPNTSRAARTRRAPPGRCIAYLSDPSAVDGPERLFSQKRAIDDYALRHAMGVERYEVDSGAWVTPAGIGFGLHSLLSEARRDAVATVLIEHVSRFATDYAGALRIAAALSSWGAEVHEARGGGVLVDPDLALRLARDAGLARGTGLVLERLR